MELPAQRRVHGPVGLQTDTYSTPQYGRASQVEKHCNLYIAALRQRQNLAQQLGQHREMSTTPSLGELYSSFGLVRNTIPSSFLAPPLLFLNTALRKASTLLRHRSAHRTEAGKLAAFLGTR